MRKFVADYSLSLVLAGLFIVSWLIQSTAGWVEFAAEQEQHGQIASLFGPSGYIWTWLEATFENWQSEFLQLFTMVVLTTFLIHRHSHESRDNQDQMQEQIEQILAELKGKGT
ncbi:MAG: hypothetical protein FIA92_13425 [Chloroflexi bacterium]|nr:hypothetical protein [Chloroflexota bacterium]